MIYIVNNFLCFILAMPDNQVFIYPGDDMVLERSLDDLME